MGKLSVKTKIKRYEKILVAVLTEYWQYMNQNNDTFLIVDKTSHHYLLLFNEWQGQTYRHSVLVHFRLAEDGKVWFLINHTQFELTDDLMQKGIPANEIVLGMQPEKLRPYTGYAVA